MKYLEKTTHPELLEIQQFGEIVKRNLSSLTAVKELWLKPRKWVFQRGRA